MPKMHKHICFLFFATADLIYTYNTQTYNKTHSVVLPICTATMTIKNTRQYCDGFWM